jgi:cytochrome c-type biogenesis protein CcmH/NrfG
MMMNREKLGFWVRLVSILLAVFFVGSFIFMGLGTNVNYNLFDLIGGSDQQQGQQGTDQTQQQIEQAEKELEENPKDPEAIKTLAALYFQENRLDDTVRVLEEGREAAPKDEEIPIFLGQVYSQQAQATPGDEQKGLYKKAGDAYAAATELEPKNEDAYLLAGEAYDQAGEPAQAIKYWNGYLELKPEGEQAAAVKARISALLEGESTTGSAQP